jgi:hypothetical protein
MNFAVVNESTRPEITPGNLARIASALTRQLCECYAPMWNATGGSVLAVPTLADVPVDWCPLVLLDNADQAGALGYHATTPNGRPYARVFVGTILDNGGDVLSKNLSVSVTMSHEVLEAARDPYANFWADNLDDGRQYALELCDPTEGDAYPIDGVLVSNFVGPRWFSLGPGPYDYMGKLSRPFSMTPGGYLIARTSSGDVHQIFGASYPDWKKASKLHPAARTKLRTR